MPDNAKQLFAGFRKKNGQIGYLSESISIPEFFNLILPSTKNNILIDFSPIIEALHLAHKKSAEQSILEKYNSVFNYWQEANSYSKPEIKLVKSETLSSQSNELINTLQFKLEEYKSQYRNSRAADIHENFKIIKSIESAANIYIDTLLCFIHSKASLEIESFKSDVVLHQYCLYLSNTISELFYRAVEFNVWNKSFTLDNSSLLYFIAFNHDKDVESYTQLLPNFDNSNNLKLLLLDKQTPINNHFYPNEEFQTIEIKYRKPHNLEIEIARILRDILYKTSSLIEMLKKLKNGGIEWDNSESSIKELRDIIFDTRAN